MGNRYLYITLLSILGFNVEAGAQHASPRLVVNIIVDQLCSDRLESFSPVYGNDGFKRLLSEGVVYSNASYSFSPVDRASGIAALSTGTTPYYNGITASEWLNRQTLRPQRCVYDEQHRYSPALLAVSTIGDELKMASNGAARVYAVAADADAAILAAGHAADGALWIEQDRWTYSSYYQPLSTWATNYSRLTAAAGDANACITELAINCARQTGMGTDDKADLLSVVYQAGTQMESYLSLDRCLAKLITTLGGQFGVDRVLFVLTSTGREEEEDTEAPAAQYRIPSGLFYINRTANLLNMYLGAVYGNGKYVEQCYRNQLFLNHRLLDQKNIEAADILRRAQDFLLQISGVSNVYTSRQLLTSDSYRLERVRNGFHIDRCGDLLIEVAPGWKLVNEDTHQTYVSRSSFIPFPIIFFGAGLKAERVQIPVAVERIAPTIAHAIHIRAPNACSSEPLF
ncbi:MAG: alkaline phosphatase family protein [Prevotella sp.]|nr:alkaline phosphatase family protein [Prevotella sp.]